MTEVRSGAPSSAPQRQPAKELASLRTHRQLAILAIVLLLGFALRGVRLNFQPLWWDEGYSVWFATHPLGQMAALTSEDIHPPLYYALLHGWTALLGADPVVLRLLSVAFGVLAIPALYLAARQIFGRSRTPLLAASLLALNPLHVFYSQEVRMYGLVALLSIAILAAASRIMDEQQTTNDEQTPSILDQLRLSSFAIYVLLAALALYTQYYAVFLPIGLTVYALWRWRRDGRALAHWLAAQAAIALLYLPWVLYAAPKLVSYVSQKVVADADKPLGIIIYAARHLAAFIAGHLEGPLTPWWPAALILLLPIIIGLWSLFTRSQTARQRHAIRNTQYAVRTNAQPFRGTQSAVLMLITVLVATLLLGWLISLRAPFFPERGERLLMLALPPFILLAAAALDALLRRWHIAGYVTLTLVVVTSVASLAAFYTVPRYADDDYRSLIAHVTEQGLPGDTVYCVYPWQVGYWRSYAPTDGPTPLLSPATAWDQTVAAALDTALARGRVWFPAHLALGGILETQAEAHLAAHAAPFVNEWHGPGTRLSAWADTAVNDTNFANEDISIRYALPGGETLLLRAVSGSTEPAPAANAVTPIVLAWQANTAPPVLKASVRLTDDLGQIWAQHDYEPLGGLGASVTPSATAGGAKGFAVALVGDSSLPTVAQNDNTQTTVVQNDNAQTAVVQNDKAQTTVALNDREGWRATDRLGLLIPAGTPPGRYRVELVVRPKGSDRALDALTPDGSTLGQSAKLFDLNVTAANRLLGAERLPIATRKQTDLSNGLRFLGFSTDQAPLTPGELRKVSLFWQATAQPMADTIAFVQVLGRDGAPVALWEASPGAAYPTSAWSPGTLMRTQASLRVPASVPDGRYRLIAGLFRTADKSLVRAENGAGHIALGTIILRGRSHQMTPPQPQRPMDVVFGSTARLVGYDIATPETRPGGTFTLTLHWQAFAATDRPYTVFVHLVDASGGVQGYGDAEPGSGAFPTPGWLAGEYLADGHTVAIAPDAAPGAYHLAVGFYDPASGERLRTLDGADQVVLDIPIQVE